MYHTNQIAELEAAHPFEAMADLAPESDDRFQVAYGRLATEYQARAAAHRALGDTKAAQDDEVSAQQYITAVGLVESKARDR
jgi:hypothetical protein